MSRRATLTFKNDPQTSFSLEEGAEFVVGRSRECDIELADNYVSRRQAKIYHHEGNFLVENIGNNPILVNGSNAVKRILGDGDELTFGKTVLLFQFKEEEAEIPAAEPSAETPETDRTIFVVEPKAQGPRLVVTGPGGRDAVYPLHKEETVIGRLAGADLLLDDPSVSRRHCVVERRGDHFHVKNLSETNPVLADNKPLSEKVLHSGDQLRIGVFSVAFISDRPEDARPPEEKVVYRGRGSSIAAWLIVSVVVLAAAGFFCYSQVYMPWKIKASLKAISHQVESGDMQSAHEALKVLLTQHLPQSEQKQAMSLFSKTALFHARKMAEAGRTKDARDYLTAFLNNYKTGDESKAIRDQVDVYRFQLAQDAEASSDPLSALRDYSGIGEESPLYEKAQQAISRIWLSTQQKELSRQPVDQLMREAEDNFNAKRYTTPFNNNAYAIYQTILTLEPNNAVALQRVNQMKLFYRENGDKYYHQKSYSSALSFYERYLLIDPTDKGISEKAAVCRKNLPSRREPSPIERPGEPRGRHDDRVKKLLDGTGAN